MVLSFVAAFFVYVIKLCIFSTVQVFKQLNGNCFELLIMEIVVYDTGFEFNGGHT